MSVRIAQQYLKEQGPPNWICSSYFKLDLLKCTFSFYNKLTLPTYPRLQGPRCNPDDFATVTKINISILLKTGIMLFRIQIMLVITMKVSHNCERLGDLYRCNHNYNTPEYTSSNHDNNQHLSDAVLSQDGEETSLLPSVLLSIFVFYFATVIGSVLLLIFSIWL